MTDKTGRSEEKEDFWGNKYTQYYDSDGNKSGTSEEKEDFWGNKYEQYYDDKGDKAGWSEDKETFFGSKYEQHYDESDDKTGTTEEKERFFGDRYEQHYDNDKNKSGWSERKETFWGNKYEQYYDNDGKSWSGGFKQTGQQGSTYNSDSSDNTSYSSSYTSESSGFGKLFLTGVGLLGLLAFCSTINSKSDSHNAREAVSERPSIQAPLPTQPESTGTPPTVETTTRATENDAGKNALENNLQSDEATNRSSKPDQEGTLREKVRNTFRSYGTQDKMIRIFGMEVPSNAKVKVFVTQDGTSNEYSVVKFSSYAATCYIELAEQPPEFSEYELHFYW